MSLSRIQMLVFLVACAGEADKGVGGAAGDEGGETDTGSPAEGGTGGGDGAADSGADGGADGAADGADGASDGADGATDSGGDGGSDPDADGDGHPASSDCDDADPERYPGAEERCDGLDQDCDGETDEEAVDAATWYLDADGDGQGDGLSPAEACAAPAEHVANADDCEDDDALSYTGAEERCDGLDNDCDGTVDDAPADGTLYHADADGDGHGDPAASTLACEAPPGTSPSPDDCDDADPLRHPGALEYCNSADDDCDGLTDEDAVDRATWYADADGDGHGDPGASTLACAAPAGHLATGDDCHDADALTFPGSDERCDGVDNDCDSSIDEEPIDGALYYLDGDADGHGAASLRSCTLPSGASSLGGDCADSDDSVYPGADERCDSADNDCDGLVDEDSVDAVEWHLDLDMDGYGDDSSARLACEAVADEIATGGDCDDANPELNPEMVELCGDGLDNDCDADPGDCRTLGYSLDDALASLRGDLSRDYLGRSAAAGDINGDGLPDLLVGGPGHDPSYSAAGAVWAYFGPLEGERFASEADVMWSGSATSLAAGSSLAMADLDGDDIDDLVVGASGYSSTRGAAYILYGDGLPASALLSAAAATAVVGTNTGDQVGLSLAAVGDTDGDGTEDVLIGVIGDDSAYTNAGSAMLLPGSATRLGSTSLSHRTAATRFVGDAVGDYAGSAVGSAGDVNGDGLLDMLVGAYYRDLSGSGANDGSAYLFLGGGGTGVVSVSTADSILEGEGSGHNLGSKVGAGGDLDGDGYGEWLVGAQDYSGSASTIGAAYVVAGGASPEAEASWTARVTGVVAADHAGETVFSIPDMDSDGADELLVGAYGDDTGGPETGTVFFFRGPVSGALTTASADYAIVGSPSGGSFGRVMAGGIDMTADGSPDLLVGSSTDDTYEVDGGALYLFSAPGI